MTKIIAGFPATGKTYFFNNSKSAMDSDSSNFSWLSKGVRNPDFPSNYINHIKENIDKCDVILVSTHRDVYSALIDAELYFTIVYPSKTAINEYIQRYKNRGSPEAFINLIVANWDNWISDIQSIKSKYCNLIELPSGKYISDIV